MNNSYIVGVRSIVAPAHDPIEMIDVYYPPSIDSGQTNRFARRVARTIGIDQRYSILDVGAFPDKILIDNSHTPQEWGRLLISGTIEEFPLARSDIGFLSVSFNISSHQDLLPNLACQIAHETGLTLDAMPETVPYLGCAGGIFSIKSAIEYTRNNDKAAIVYVFDQCSWAAKPIHDIRDPNFKKSLRTHLLFNDGAVALLIVPDSILERKPFRKRLKVVDIDTGFYPGAAIGMKDGGFLVGDDVEATMPKLVSERSIRPLLERNSVPIDEVDEWSIHQGGITVLEAFRKQDTLGLTDSAIAESRDCFAEYGNLSSPSCLFVLEKNFNKPAGSMETGVVSGFGAGYYFGSMLYRTEAGWG